MTTNVKVFKSTDAGAPVLSGSASALVTLLNAVLLNGYNSKSITLSRSGSLATAVCAGHGFVTGQCLLIAGADQAEYTGEQYVTVVDANSFTFPVSAAAVTPATGTITAKLAPAGWTSPFTGTNKAVYRMSGGNQRYLRIDDTGATSARLVGYEAMTTVDAGTNAFPTEVQVTGGLYVNKSSVADTSARAWVALATDRLLHVWINAGPTVGLICGHYCFGDIKSFAGGDQFQTLIVGQTSYSASAVGAYQALVTTAAYPTPTAGCYLARAYTQTASAIAVGKHADAAKLGSVSAMLGGAGLAYPNPADGGLYLSPLFIHEAGAIRGTLPGVWAPLHARPFGCYDTVAGSGTLAGRNFLAFHAEGSSAAVADGQLLYETSNTWDL